MRGALLKVSDAEHLIFIFIALLTLSGQNVVITVTDDGAGICGEKIAEIRRELAGNRTKGEHIGICNVNQRVRLRYGEEYGVTVESICGEYTRVEITLPGDWEETES